MSVRWSRQALEALGPTTDVPTTASVLGVDKDTVYSQIRRGEWTFTRVLRLGRKIKIPTLDLIQLLYGAGLNAAPSTDEGECRCEKATQTRSSGAVTPHTQCDCTHSYPGVVHQLRGA